VPRDCDSGMSCEYWTGWKAGENWLRVMFRYTTVASVRDGVPPSEASTRNWKGESP